MKEERFREAKDNLTSSVALCNELGVSFFAARDLFLLAAAYHGSENLNKSDQPLNKAM